MGERSDRSAAVEGPRPEDLGSAPRSGRSLAALLLVASVATALAAFDLGRQGLLADPFVAYADQTFQAALVERSLDPGTFARDELLVAIDAFWPDTVFELLAATSRCFGSLETTSTVWTLCFAFVFTAGVFRLGRDLFSPAVGVVVALATAATVRVAPVAEWGVVPWIPRFCNLAFAPWCLHALWFGRGPRARLLLGVGLGAMASVHSLSALQLTGLIGGLAVLGRPRLAIGEWGALVGGTVLGAVPAVLSLPDLGGLEPATVEELADTCFAYYVHQPLYQVLRFLVHLAVPLGITLLAGLLGGFGQATSRERAAEGIVLRLGALALLGAFVHPLLVALGKGLSLCPARLAKYAFLAALLLAAQGIVRLGRRRGVVAAIALALLLVLPVDRWIYERAWSLPLLGPAMTASRAELPELFRSDYSMGERGPLLTTQRLKALGEEIAAVVPKDALLLVPPRGASPLRLAARRSCYVLGEDSVVALYDRRTLLVFRERMDRALRAYREGPGAVSALAQQERCDAYLVPADWDVRPDRWLWKDADYGLVEPARRP